MPSFIIVEYVWYILGRWGGIFAPPPSRPAIWEQPRKIPSWIGLRAKCIQSVINPNAESDNDGSNLEQDVDDAMEINSKPAGNLGEALAMLNKSQLLIQENDAENKVFRTFVSLTKKSWENMNEIKETKNYQWFF